MTKPPTTNGDSNEGEEQSAGENSEPERYDLERFAEELLEVRPNTQTLIRSMFLDVWPSPAVLVDFGIKSQEHYEALYYLIRNDEIMPKTLDAALGSGKKLTELARSSRTNPHKTIEFHTDWDDLLEFVDEE